MKKMYGDSNKRHKKRKWKLQHLTEDNPDNRCLKNYSLAHALCVTRIFSCFTFLHIRCTCVFCQCHVHLLQSSEDALKTNTVYIIRNVVCYVAESTRNS